MIIEAQAPSLQSLIRSSMASTKQADPAGIQRHFRQELRVAINEILGYTSLIREAIEEVADSERRELLPDLAHIETAGERLLAHTNAFFHDKAAEPDAAELCHTLRGPLTSVIGYSDLLLEDAEQYDEQLVRDLRKIHAAGSRLLDLVGAFLEFNRTRSEADENGDMAFRSRAAITATTVPASMGGRLSGSILVVDDEEANRELLARRLGRLGCSVTLAPDGETALKLLERRWFDLVLLDIRLTGISGYEVLAYIRSKPDLAKLPIIVLSASDELEAMVQCVELGANDYLAKPVHPTLLVARVRAMLEQKRLHDQEALHLQTIEAQKAQLAEWGRTLEGRVARQVDELERVNRLRRFLSPQVADLIVSSGQEDLLTSHSSEVTVLFCDMRGYTALADRSNPEVLMDLISRYHAVLGPLIHEFEGTLERFTGDGVMVFFNDPLPTPDHSERAVGLALAMRDKVAQLLRGVEVEDGTLGFGIGIARGHGTLGRIGFEGRFDYACLGNVTNRAARLCSEAADGQIVIDGKVFEAVADRVAAEQLPDLKLKGLRKPVPAWNVVSAL